MSQVTTSAPTSSMFEAYSVELHRLTSSIVGFLEVAERRTDLASPHDARVLAEMSATVDELGRRLAAFAATTRTALPAGFVSSPRRSATEPSAEDTLARRIESMAGPAVQGSVAETVGGTFGLRQQEYAHWFSLQSRHGNERADTQPGRPRDVNPTANTIGVASGSPTTPTSSSTNRISAPLMSKEVLANLLSTVGGEVAMKGTTESMAMPQVFDFLVRLKRTGCLHLRTSTEHLRFVFVEGMIVATATDNQPNGQRIGEILRQLGLLPRRHLTALIARAEAERRPLGRLLVDEQLLTIPQISKALTIQIQARFERAFGATRAAFAFVPNSGERIDDRVCVDARALLSELRRRQAGDGSDEPPQPTV